MKLFVYNLNKYDEINYFQEFGDEFNISLEWSQQAPSLENAHLAEGADSISILTSPIDQPLIEKFSSLGVKMISTRTIGYDHIDIEAAKKHGITVCNAIYAPDSVADYTVMLMLMTIRNMKQSLDRFSIRNYAKKGLKGKSIRNLNIGIIGTGQIGTEVIRRLSGFHCNIYAYDYQENCTAKKYAEYKSLNFLLENSDIISLHVPASDKTHHMINKRVIKNMKDGAVIINTARGALIDTNALIDALESGKIAGAGLDTLEEEANIFYKDLTGEPVSHRQLSILKDYPNVILTPHIAYYTDEAVKGMVYSSVKSCYLFNHSEPNPYQVS